MQLALASDSRLSTTFPFFTSLLLLLSPSFSRSLQGNKRTLHPLLFFLSVLSLSHSFSTLSPLSYVKRWRLLTKLSICRAHKSQSQKKHMKIAEAENLGSGPGIFSSSIHVLLSQQWRPFSLDKALAVQRRGVLSLADKRYRQEQRAGTEAKNVNSKLQASCLLAGASYKCPGLGGGFL